MSRARCFGAAKRTLDTASSSHKLSLEGEGKKTLESRGAGFVVRLCPAQAARPTHRFCYRAKITLRPYAQTTGKIISRRIGIQFDDGR